MPTIKDSITYLRTQSNLTGENIDALFAIIHPQGKALAEKTKNDKDNKYTCPWNLQSQRADLKVAAWLKGHGKPATYEQIAEGMGEQFDGVTADAIQQIVEADQQNKEQFRKFMLDGKAVDVRVKKVKKATVSFTKKA